MVRAVGGVRNNNTCVVVVVVILLHTQLLCVPTCFVYAMQAYV